MDDRQVFENEKSVNEPDPDETPIKDRRVITQQYDLVVDSLIEQITNKTVYLRPISERPSFQRRYVWTNLLASRLIESILLNVPIPPCYLSQNDNYELDVIDGQQRIFSIYRFVQNQFSLTSLEVLTELNGKRYHQLPPKFQRQLTTHTLRCVIITNESQSEIKFDVFERLNTNTVPLNAQELRNCIYRGALNSLVKDSVEDPRWLNILGRKEPDNRMRDAELVLRFFAFWLDGIESYRTPQKHWLNEVAKKGRNYSQQKIGELDEVWKRAIEASLAWFAPEECFRRERHGRKRAINRALFDLVMQAAARTTPEVAHTNRRDFRLRYTQLLENDEFMDLISRAVDHKKRAIRRFELWNEFFDGLAANAPIH